MSNETNMCGIGRDFIAKFHHVAKYVPGHILKIKHFHLPLRIIIAIA
jgi:hypothetical protein